MTEQAITESHLDARLDALRHEVRADIAQLETRITKWIVGTMLTAALGSAAVASSITFAALRLAG